MARRSIDAYVVVAGGKHGIRYFVFSSDVDGAQFIKQMERSQRDYPEADREIFSLRRANVVEMGK